MAEAFAASKGGYGYRRVKAMLRTGVSEKVIRGIWIGNGVLDRFLEDESLLCEFVGAPVCEGGVESLVVGPPHIVVGVGA